MVVTNQAIAELRRWAAASSDGDAENAESHLQQFYHVGSALVASKDFQAYWREKGLDRLEPDQFELVCKVLRAIAGLESGQVQKYGKATA
jgi:hypothetical protein